MKFKKTLMVSLAAVLAASSVVGLAACGEDGDSGSGKGGKGKTTTIQFWGQGDADELKVFGDIVNTFNNTIGKEKGIKVNYSGDHDDSAANALKLSGNNPPDVIYVPDGDFKFWAGSGWLENLTNTDGTPKTDYAGLDEFLQPGKIWEQGINRYRYDITTQTSTPDTKLLWALPKDIGPTVLYYNREYLKEIGVEHISLDPTDAEFKAAGYPEKGYFQHTDGKWYFNNRVPMSWDEVTDLAQAMEKEIGPRFNTTGKKTFYGYFTEWWFNYGWSIGGDCVEYVPETDTTGYYEFTLDDKSVNWIVKDEETSGIDIGGTHYGPGETISYMDKKSADFTSAKQAKCNQLPSMYDAFLEFCSLTTPKTDLVGKNSKNEDVYGKDVSMGQLSIGTQSARNRFAAGTMGMFVGGRWEVTHLRKTIGTQGSWMKDNDSWDVAPLPVYKEYYEEGDTIPAGKKVGDIKVHGVQAGHSGSMGLAITRKSKYKKEAWELVKYIAGEPGQTSQSLAGFCIPNQVDIAKSDTFLQPTLAPKNAQVFVDAAQYETPGDWWYLKDGNWITKWADCLNKEVREPGIKEHKTVAQLFEIWGDYTRDLLYKYTKSSKNP